MHTSWYLGKVPFVFLSLLTLLSECMTPMLSTTSVMFWALQFVLFGRSPYQMQYSCQTLSKLQSDYLCVNYQ